NVLPTTPADSAGLKVTDIIVSVDGEPVDNVPRVAFQLFAKSAGDHLALTVLRGTARVTVDVIVDERSHDFDHLTDRVDPAKSLVSRLGILGVDVDDETARW